jgi:NADH dehydrogenase
VLYNTYWVRFNHRLFRHADAVRNTRVLFEAARRAGVERIVHVSITNPSEDSPLEYFRGKAELERALRETGVPYAILRPTVLFGREDILVNNIAWALRHLPVFGVFGDGNYRLQPIHVEDLAELAARYGGSRENLTIDAIGPETFTYRELAQTIRQALRRRTPILGVPKQVGYLVGRLVGWWVRDELVTWEEVLGLTANLLYTPSPPAGHTRLTDWIAAQAATLGLHYASELARRRDRSLEYSRH